VLDFSLLLIIDQYPTTKEYQHHDLQCSKVAQNL
jgi:hypothetical protein